VRAQATASAPWVDEESTQRYEIEEIRGQLAAVWRSINEDMEARLAGNGENTAVISDLFAVGRAASLLLAASSDPDALSLVSAQLQDLLVLRARGSNL